ncbi:ras-related and estrogen-regulated growth inhibitor-like protein [Nothobranchius furzeri]|uniref:small monomeric GTPase n=3 Tax=Nothobranchius TaxID=28779 RepID=A0A8C6LMW1_NOTFU|nr:ras-related and estrogen-regulated growth inhibitor-like protein [Nothobranchius furzeri]KAF7224479.1 ras-related and estrogen-regulated growth inhibitor-like protein [Nothobranchius furzeri]
MNDHCGLMLLLWALWSPRPPVWAITALSSRQSDSSLLTLTWISCKISTKEMEANVVVMGTESVGKSALTVRLLTRRFIGEYGDIESIYSHSFTIEGRELTLNLWDSPYFQHLSVETSPFHKKVRWADGFILVYSICDRASFNAVSKLIQSIKSTKDFLREDKVPIVIVGNKRDLHHRRTVLSEEGRLLALNMDCLFYEVSAAENYDSVLTMFHGLMERIKEAKLTIKRPQRFKGIVKSMSAVFTRRRTDSF